MSEHDLQEWRLARQRGFVSNETLWTIGYTLVIISGLLAIVYTH